jgi:hypothetical protein
VLARKIRRLRPGLVLLQNPYDLIFREPCSLHLSVLQEGRTLNPRGGKSQWQVSSYAAKYLAENDNATKDERAINAGTAIRNGSYTKANFRIIYEWKLESFLKRKLPYLNPENIDQDDVEEAMRLAATARTVRAAAAVLMGLPSVKNRVASAVLAMIRPDRYTVLDVRALEALGVPNEHDDGSVNFYVAYLAECQKLAARYKVDLRTFDRALFQWSAEQAKSRRPGHRISD